MKKLPIILLLFLITTLAFGQYFAPNQKPMLGEQVNGAHPLSKGLVSCWLFNEGSGNKVFDLSGNGNTGTYTGAPDWGAGFYGPQVRCDNDQYITFANKATNYITDKFTIVWVGTPAQLTSSIRRFFVGQYQLDSNHYDWGLYIQTDYTVSLFVNTGSAVYSTTTSSLSVGVKTHIIATYDGANLRIYFNGIEQDSDAQTGNVTGNYDFRLGGFWNATQYADVKTDVLNFYNRTLSPSEISELYQKSFCIFVEDDIALMEAAIPAPTGGQVIIISKAVVPFILVLSLILIKRRKAA